MIVSHHNHTSNHLTTMELSNNNQTCYSALIKTLQSEKVREKLSDYLPFFYQLPLSGYIVNIVGAVLYSVPEKGWIKN